MDADENFLRLLFLKKCLCCPGGEALGLQWSVWGTLDMSPIYGSSGGYVYGVWGWGSAEPP